MERSVNTNIQIRETPNKGKGVFAVNLIRKGSLIFNWEDEGIIYEANKASELPGNLKDYAVQFASNKWIDTQGIGRNLNHSCSPNTGIHGLFKIIAIRDIQPNEEIVWDYDTTENSDWFLSGGCKCNSINCRKEIKGYRYLSDELKKEYRDITSDWLK